MCTSLLANQICVSAVHALGSRAAADAAVEEVGGGGSVVQLKGGLPTLELLRREVRVRVWVRVEAEGLGLD